MWYPRKPHLFGNEWCTISDGLSNIMYTIEIVEGKDRPVKLQNQTNKKSEYGAIIGILLCLAKVLYNMGKVVIHDSEFCVLQGLIELRKVGVFASTVIKERKYWPNLCPGKHKWYIYEKTW